jgi:AraC-like DNA-binding protein
VHRAGRRGDGSSCEWVQLAVHPGRHVAQGHYQWFNACGCGCHATYLARWRLHHGATLLQTTSRAIIEIAGDVGYESEAAFNRAFKREFGAPPGRYRRARAGETVA